METHDVDKLVDIFRIANAYDKHTGMIQYERIWGHPASRRAFADILIKYYTEILSIQFEDRLPKKPNEIVLLAPDTLAGGVNFLPVTALVADGINAHFAIWKEVADIRWGTSAIVGDQIQDLTCIVVQDPFITGFTVVRLAQSMKLLNWRLPLLFSVVSDLSQNIKELNESLSDVKDILGDAPETAYMISNIDLKERIGKDL